MRIGAVQLLPQRDRALPFAVGQEHGLGVALDDLFHLAGEHRARHRREAVVREHGDPRLFGVPATICASGTCERVLIVEHVQPVHAQRLHQLDLRRSLRDVAGLQASERALAAGIEAFGLVLPGVEGRGQPDVRARRADLQDARRVDQRQRDRCRRRVEVAEIGDRAGVLRGDLRVGRGDARAPLAARRVGVVERDEADLERARVSARLGQRELLAADDLLRRSPPRDPAAAGSSRPSAGRRSLRRRPRRPRRRSRPLPAARRRRERPGPASARALWGLATTAGEVAGEDLQRRSHQDDHRCQQERVEALGARAPTARSRRPGRAVTVRTSPIARVILASRRETRSQFADQRRHRRRPGRRASPAARTRRVPTITPSAPASAACAACSGVPIPKPSATGTSVLALARATTSAKCSAERAALAGRADDRDRVEEAPRAARRSPPDARACVVGATSGTSARPRASHAREHLGGLALRQVGHDQPAGAGCARRRSTNASTPGAKTMFA